MRGCFFCVAVFFLVACGGGSSTPEQLQHKSTPTPTPDVLNWPVTEGLFGSAQSSFEIPVTSAAAGLYLPDIQASYPAVNWQTINRLYIPAGHYKFIRLGNLPERAANNPLVITNKGGQVRVGGLDHYYMFVISGGTNWVLTGRYDAVSETGNENFPGHRGGRFANTQDRYGIMVDDDFIRNSVSGLSISNATDFEVEYLEIKEVGFAGMTMKTDNDGNAVMANVLLHDNYIHDTGSEGLYIGSTQAQPQHQIRDWEIYNNRILRTGTEAIQLGQLAGHNKVHHNVFGPAAMDWRAAFQAYQDNNFQIGIREGFLQVYNNIFIGSADSSISFFAHAIEGDQTDENVGVSFENNYFTAIRNFGMYLNSTALENMAYQFVNNTFGGYQFLRDEVYNATAPSHLLRVMNVETPITFENNTWFGPQNFVNKIENNGVSNNITSIDNVNGEPSKLTFVNSGLANDFDYLTIEMWTDVSTLGEKNSVSYEQNDIVMYLGLPYRCDVTICESGNVPAEHSEMWMPLLPLADDVRIVPGTTWQALGLQPL